MRFPEARGSRPWKCPPWPPLLLKRSCPATWRRDAAPQGDAGPPRSSAGSPPPPGAHLWPRARVLCFPLYKAPEGGSPRLGRAPRRASCAFRGPARAGSCPGEGAASHPRPPATLGRPRPRSPEGPAGKNWSVSPDRPGNPPREPLERVESGVPGSGCPREPWEGVFPNLPSPCKP